MSHWTVLVSGASGIVGYGILRSLRMSGLPVKLVGTTIYDDSIAQAFCDKFEKAPKTTDASYLDWLQDVIVRNKVHILFPGIEDDVHTWQEHRGVIEKAGVRLVLNRGDLIELCKDKWVFHEELKKSELPYRIESGLFGDFSSLSGRFGLPFILKPKRGFGGRGIVVVENEEMFLRNEQQLGKTLMAQQMVGRDEEEFTTSAFGDGNGNSFCHLTLRRKLSKEGFTEKAEVVELGQIDQAISDLCRYFKPEGPTNFQFRLHKGELKLLEINPRVSSATSIRAHFGFNEAALAVEYFLNGHKPKVQVTRRGYAVRYVEDYIYYS